MSAMKRQLEEYLAWLDEGIKAGYISYSFCMTHDGDPYLTEEENEEWENGGDPCGFVVKLLLETGHPPMDWKESD